MGYKVEWADIEGKPQYAVFDTEEDAARFKEVVEKVHGPGQISSDGVKWILNDRRGEKSELKFLKAFARESSFDNELCRDQFRSLWTAHCIYHNLDVDTRDYDTDLWELWEVVDESDCSDWHDYSTFYNFMCRFLA